MKYHVLLDLSILLGSTLHAVIPTKAACCRVGSEGSSSPVGYPAKQEATRTSQPKQAIRPLQGSSVTIEVAGESLTKNSEGIPIYSTKALPPYTEALFSFIFKFSFLSFQYSFEKTAPSALFSPASRVFIELTISF
ncbi:MAG: hypothetical protein IJK71_04225 [Clostridia bacterium]|nr:hypothetical protein [Clostridia bacterium]